MVGGWGALWPWLPEVKELELFSVELNHLGDCCSLPAAVGVSEVGDVWMLLRKWRGGGGRAGLLDSRRV